MSQFDPSSSVSAIFSDVRSTGAGKFQLKIVGYPNPSWVLGGRGKKEENEEEKEKWKEIICVVEGDFVFHCEKVETSPTFDVSVHWHFFIIIIFSFHLHGLLTPLHTGSELLIYSSKIYI